ncbi:hypothetical protein P885DRAFT_62432 [Corynascus similis CBS 632.67]
MSTTNETVPKVSVVLKAPTDWFLWHQQFRARIQQADLAKYFDGERDLLPKPLAFFDPMKAIDDFKAERYLHHYRQEAYNREIEIPDDHSRFEVTVARPQHNSLHQFAREHSAEDYNNVKDYFLMSKHAEFEAKEKAYSKEKKELATIREWLYASVDKQYQQSYFLPDNSLRQWYDDLKGAVLQPHVVTIHVRKKLLNHVNTMSRRQGVKPEEFEQWVREWENLFEQAKQLGVAETTHPTSWCEDLLTAVTHLSPGIIDTYKATFEYDGPNAVTFRDVSRSLIRLSHDLTLDQKSGRVVTGAFSTFGPPQEENERQTGLPTRSISKRRINERAVTTYSPRELHETGKNAHTYETGSTRI